MYIGGLRHRFYFTSRLCFSSFRVTRYCMYVLWEVYYPVILVYVAWLNPELMQSLTTVALFSETYFVFCFLSLLCRCDLSDSYIVITFIE